MPQIYFGRRIAERRKRKGLTQEEVAAVLGMTRANYSQMETGKRKEVLQPDQAVKLARLLEIDMVELVTIMGYPIRLPADLSPRALAIATAWEKAHPEVQQAVARGLEAET